MTHPSLSRPTSAIPIGSADRAEPGMVVGGRYTLHAALGNGGMGTVWRGLDTLLRRDVAVKEVAPPPGVSTTEREALYERMMREARAAAVISHPSVVQVYDVVTDGGRPWIVMELLDARSLADIVVEDGPLAPRAVAKIGMAMLGALEMAHAAGVLHRDVKPANVLICTDGRPVLTDFGVARMPSDQQLTTPGMVLGSPHFISPERAMGAPFGPPSDLFSLGVTLYAAVEGHPPFDKGDPIGTMHSVVEDPPRPMERAGVLTEVLYGLLEKEPSRRWDAGAARQALRSLLAGPLASQTPQFPTDPYSVVPARSLPAPAPPVRKVGGRAMLPPTDGHPIGPAEDVSESVPHQRTSDYQVVPTAEHRFRPARRHQVKRESWTGPDRVAERLARAAGRVYAKLRALPRNVRLAGAAGLVLLLVTGGIMLLSGDDQPESESMVSSGGQPPVAESAAPEPDEEAAPFAVQEFADRGIVVNLPERWQQTESTSIRVDFADPDNPELRLRLLFEESGAEAMAFIQAIEVNIENNCPSPYQRTGLSEIKLAEVDAGQLEYTCGNADNGRHGRWATVVHDGTAFSFFVSVPPDQSEEGQMIFDEMVRSFRFG